MELPEKYKGLGFGSVTEEEFPTHNGFDAAALSKVPAFPAATFTSTHFIDGVWYLGKTPISDAEAATMIFAVRQSLSRGHPVVATINLSEKQIEINAPIITTEGPMVCGQKMVIVGDSEKYFICQNPRGNAHWFNHDGMYVYSRSCFTRNVRKTHLYCASFYSRP